MQYPITCKTGRLLHKQHIFKLKYNHHWTTELHTTAIKNDSVSTNMIWEITQYKYTIATTSKLAAIDNMEQYTFEMLKQE